MMILHTTALLYIISLFNGKVRRNAILSLEFSAVAALIMSVLVYDEVHNVDEILTINQDDSMPSTSTFIDSNGIQYNVTDRYRHDTFTDLVKYLTTPRSDMDMDDTEKQTFELVIIRTVFNESDNPTMAEVLGKEVDPNATSFYRFQMSVRKQELYRENDPLIDELLHDLATSPIESVAQYKGGTQIKIYVNFTNKGRAMMKPMKCERDQQTNPNHIWFRDLERHNAEIAAFHLDRALGYRRAAPVSGRWLNITAEIEAVGDEVLKDTVFISPANNKCFHGTNCSQYCNIEHPLCGNPEMIEVAMAAFLPFFESGDEIHMRNPWRRAYSHRRKAAWLKDDDYCAEVQVDPIYEKGRRLLDVVDVSILDYFIGNQDRHHYELFRTFGDEDSSTSSPIHLDHGRSFGKPFWDDPVIISPIKHCCKIRESTLATLLKYHNGPIKLSDQMRKSMANDPVAPILWEPYFAALDRRVGNILHEVRLCMNRTRDYMQNMKEQLADMKESDRADANSTDAVADAWSDSIPRNFSDLENTSSD